MLPAHHSQAGGGSGRFLYRQQKLKSVRGEGGGAGGKGGKGREAANPGMGGDLDKGRAHRGQNRSGQSSKRKQRPFRAYAVGCRVLGAWGAGFEILSLEMIKP